MHTINYMAIIDKRRLVRTEEHLLRPPRLKAEVHKRGIKPFKKRKKTRLEYSDLSGEF
jgi:hypothetical protein